MSSFQRIAVKNWLVWFQGQMTGFKSLIVEFLVMLQNVRSLRRFELTFDDENLPTNVHVMTDNSLFSNYLQDDLKLIKITQIFAIINRKFFFAIIQRLSLNFYIFFDGVTARVLKALNFGIE